MCSSCMGTVNFCVYLEVLCRPADEFRHSRESEWAVTESLKF